MYKFSETIRYKDTLFTAIFDHQLKLNADFEKSYIYIDELVSMLESLDYQKFREEALDKDVKKYLIDIDKKDRKTGNILRDTPEDVKEAMTRLIYQLRDAAIKQHEAGSWGGDQLKRYRWRLTDFLVHINKRLDEFSALYSDMFTGMKIPEKALQLLETKGLIENSAAKPLRWLSTKQVLREFITNERIRGKYTVAEVERQTPTLFTDKKGQPIRLAKNKHVPSYDSDTIVEIIATL